MLVGEESRHQMCRASDVLSVLDRSRGRKWASRIPMEGSRQHVRGNCMKMWEERSR